MGCGCLIWVLEIALLLVFVGFGGFPGFIAWAVLTALVMFAQHANTQSRLKAAELVLQAERDRQMGRPAPPPALAPIDPDAQEWHHSRFTSSSSHEAWSVNFSTMVLRLDYAYQDAGSSTMGFLVRRVSPSQWEMKLHPEYRTWRIAELRRRLATDAPDSVAEDRPEAGGLETGGWREGEHERYLLQHELDSLQGEFTWSPFPEEFIASIETRYQRYLLSGR